MADYRLGLDRRRFLGLSAGGALGVMAGPLLARAWGQQERTRTGARAKAVIVLYMAGGASHLDTFDPKPGTAGAGEFKAIETSIPGIAFSEHLPRLAAAAKHMTVIRSMNTKEGNHRRASYMMRTGYAPAGPVQHPGFGALIAKYKAREGFELPSNVAINDPSIGGGFLGVEYAPFVVQDPTKPVQNLSSPGELSKRRFKRRWKLLEQVEKRFAVGRRADMVEGHRKVYDAAERFMHSPLAKAFDVSREPQELREAYGMNRFGQGCLMARRLVETGVPFVEVTMPGWDTHRDNFNTIKKLSADLDPAFSTLLQDLRDRKLLDSTLVVWKGDFGRTPRINANIGRDHFPGAWTSVLAGAGVAEGLVLGSSGPQGYEAAGRVVTAADLYATYAELLKLDGGVENISKSGRPITVTDKEGSVIKEIL